MPALESYLSRRLLMRPAAGDELTGNGCDPGCDSSWYISVRAGSRHADELQGVARRRGEEHGCRVRSGAHRGHITSRPARKP
jgi:hypothetical protein